MLKFRERLRRVRARDYPESLQHLESYRETLRNADGPPHRTLDDRYLARDQTAQNTLRLALLTMAHYERRSLSLLFEKTTATVERGLARARKRIENSPSDSSGDGASPSGSSAPTPPPLLDDRLVRDAVSEEPMMWRAADESNEAVFEICYRRPEQLREEVDPEHDCWGLPPRDDELPDRIR